MLSAISNVSYRLGVCVCGGGGGESTQLHPKSNAAGRFLTSGTVRRPGAGGDQGWRRRGRLGLGGGGGRGACGSGQGADRCRLGRISDGSAGSVMISGDRISDRRRRRARRAWFGRGGRLVGFGEASPNLHLIYTWITPDFFTRASGTSCGFRRRFADFTPELHLDHT